MTALVYEARGPMTNLTIDNDQLILGNDFISELPEHVKTFIAEDNRSDKYLNLLMTSHKLSVKQLTSTLSPD